MTKRNPSSKRAASARLLRTPALLAALAPAAFATAAYASTGLEDARGGATFLSGALAAGEVAAPSVDTGGESGVLMRDTIIIRTSGG